jgi:hypothetical protein
MVKALVDTGNVADAQRIILRELETQFGGSARAARETLGGALKALENAFGDMFEVSGKGADDLRLAIESVVDILSDPSTQAAVMGFGGWLFESFAKAADTLRVIVTSIQYLKKGDFATFMELSAFPEDGPGRIAHQLARIRTGIDDVGKAAREQERFYDEFGDTFTRASGRAAHAVTQVGDATRATTDEVTKAKAALVDGLTGTKVPKTPAIAEAFKVGFQDVEKAAKRASDTIGKQVDIPLPRLRPDVDNVRDALLSAADAAVGFGQALVGSLSDGKGLATSLKSSLGGLSSSLLSSGMSGISTAVQGAMKGSGLGLGSGLAEIAAGPIGSIVAGIGGSLISSLLGGDKELEEARKAWAPMAKEVAEMPAAFGHRPEPKKDQEKNDDDRDQLPIAA